MRIDKDFVAIVTGGTSGLGKSTVKLLVQLGAKVVFAGTSESKGKEVQAEIKGVYFKCDISNENNVKQLFQFTKKQFGKIDAVINCAGLGVIGSIISSKGIPSNKDLDASIKLNIVGTYNVSKYAAKFMSQQPEVNGERGVIILVSSLAGEEGQNGQVVYGATKGAVNSMVLPMARDLAKYKIRVMGIAPGIFQTPMIGKVRKDVLDKISTQIPTGRIGTSDEFAKMAQAIIELQYANGTIWRFDGGFRLPYL